MNEIQRYTLANLALSTKAHSLAACWLAVLYQMWVTPLRLSKSNLAVESL